MEIHGLLSLSFFQMTGLEIACFYSEFLATFPEFLKERRKK
jgi:hypothetical protein